MPRHSDTEHARVEKLKADHAHETAPAPQIELRPARHQRLEHARLELVAPHQQVVPAGGEERGGLRRHGFGLELLGVVAEQRADGKIYRLEWFRSYDVTALGAQQSD